MAVPEIHIDSIQLNLRGISPDVANEALSSLGPTLHAALTLQLAGRTAGAGTRIGQLDAPALHVPAGVNATMLREVLAGQLAATIANQISTPSPTPSAVR
jgi:hypothetical protein